MKKVMSIFFFVLLVTGCTNPQSATEVLEKEGYKNIEMTGYNFFSCSKDDFYHTGFTAEKNGHKVKGTVCEGFIFKGKTIRYD